MNLEATAPCLTDARAERFQPPATNLGTLIRPRVVLVDDDACCRASLRRPLNLRGYSVAEAEEGLDAIELVRNWPADVVVTDILMPRMDGLELILRLRLQVPWVPVIAITGAAESQLHSARERGAVAVLAKPFDVEDLAQAIRRVLSRDRPGW